MKTLKSILAVIAIIASASTIAEPQTMQEYVNEKISKKCQACSENVVRAMAESDFKTAYLVRVGSGSIPEDYKIDVKEFWTCGNVPGCGMFSEANIKYRPVRSYHYR